jgi:hypothetical protein
MLIHPKALPPDTQYAIDQFVLRGGHLLVFVDPDAESDPTGSSVDPNQPAQTRSSDLPILFASWGFPTILRRWCSTLRRRCRCSRIRPSRRCATWASSA